MMNELNFEKLYKCCEREANIRKKVYPKWVESGKMQHLKAIEEIELMEQAAAYFKGIYDKSVNESEQRKLF